jgi:Fic family protein
MDNLEELAGEYNKLSKGVVDFDKYTYYAITHHSTSIEGSTLTESQVVNLLEYGKPAPNKPFEHHQMVYDHFLALKYVVEASKEKRPFDVDFIRAIGAKVMHSTGGVVNSLAGTYHVELGEFRRGSVRAGMRTFPDYQKVPVLMTQFCREANDGLLACHTFWEQCQLAFKLHFDFVSIHPFGDGNGRTSRLIMNYVLAYFGLPLAIVYRQDRLRYIDALEASRTKEDMAPFFGFMQAQYAKFLKAEIAEMRKRG